MRRQPRFNNILTFMCFCLDFGDMGNHSTSHWLSMCYIRGGGMFHTIGSNALVFSPQTCFSRENKKKMNLPQAHLPIINDQV